MEIKNEYFARVDKARKSGSIVSTVSSGLSINGMAAERSDDFKAHFCGTHFFNPPRYLQLLEIIPTASTNPEIVDFLMDYGSTFLGKKTVQEILEEPLLKIPYK